MREIKFRAWDNLTKKIYRVTSWVDGSVHLSGNAEEGEHSRLMHEVILMQYIGLKDKNAVLIYDGDFLDNGIAYGEVYQADSGTFMVRWHEHEEGELT